MFLTVLMVLILLTGCLDYKPYDNNNEDLDTEELDLINEIAEIEKELGLSDDDLEEDDDSPS